MASSIRPLFASLAIVAVLAWIGNAQDIDPPALSTFAAGPAALSIDDIPDVLIGPDSGIRVSRLLSGADGSELASGYPFGPDFAGGVRLASGDVNGDGIPDPIAATGPGRGFVRVYNGSNLTVIAAGRPFGPGFTGGLFVASGDVDADGRADIIVAQDQGGGAVTAFRGDATAIGTMTPFGAGYTGGVRVAAGDVTGDGVDDLIAAQATGGVVTIVSGATRAAIISAAPYGASIPGGVYVATADINGDEVDDVIVAPGSGSGVVLVFDVRAGNMLGSITPYEPGFGGGVRVAAADLTGDRRADIITAPGPGGQPLLRVFDGATLAPLASVLAYDVAFDRGLFVASIDVPSPPKFTSTAATTFQAGESNTFAVTTDGRPSVRSITLSGSLPAGVTFTDRGDGAATIAGTPPVGTSGVFPIALTAANHFGATVVQNFSLTVESRCPVITVMPTVLPDATVGVPWAVQFAQSGATGPVTWHLESGSYPSSLIFDPTGALSGTPSAEMVGSYTFTVAATMDDGCSGRATVSLNVLPTPNQPPIVAAATIAYDAIGNTQLHVAGATRPGVTALVEAAGILAKSGAADADGPAPLTTVPQTNVATLHGSVTLAADGSFSYVPSAGFTGVDSFVAQITDSRDTVAVTINIAIANRVWYVNNRTDGNNPAGGDGRSTDAFESLTAAEAASADNDVIFVFRGDTSDMAMPLDGGIRLKNGQKLIGEHVGLTIGAIALVPPSIIRPRVVASTGAAVYVRADAAEGNRTGVEVRGLDLRVATAEAAVQASSAGAQLLGIEVSDNWLSGPAAGIGMGLSVVHGSSGTATLSVHDNLAFDVQAGLVLRRDEGSMVITALNDNTIVGPLANGIVVQGPATFDAIPGGPLDVVSGGVTTIGSSGAQTFAAGLQLEDVSGRLAFAVLNIWAGGGVALRVAGTGTFTGMAGTTFSAGGGISAIDATGAELEDLTANVQLASLASTGGTRGLLLTNVAGTFSAGAGRIEETATTDVAIIGGTANVSYGGTITDDAGPLITVTGTTGGTKIFTGAISDGNDGDGGGILLDGNAGATITFAGGLTLSTGTVNAFTASGGGTINVCDDNPCASGTGALINRLATSTGTALTVSNATIGANNLEFRSISSNGGTTNGIMLADTGTAGGLKVKGTGAAGSGGTIQNKATGISLNNTRNVALNGIHLHDLADSAITGVNVSGFDLRQSVIDGVNGDDWPEGSVSFRELTGVATFADTAISGGWWNDVAVVNTSGVLDRLTFSNVSIGPNGVIGADGVALYAEDATMNVTVTNSTFTSARQYPFEMVALNATADLVFSNNALSNNHPNRLSSAGGVRISGQGSGPVTLTYSVAGNTFRDAWGSALEVFKFDNPGSVTGEIRGNTFGVAGVSGSGSRDGSAITVSNRGGGTLAASIHDNVIREYNAFGIHVITGLPDSPGSGAMNVSINGNTISDPGTDAVHGLRIDGGRRAGDSHQLCADIGNVTANTLTGSGANGSPDFALFQNYSTTIRLPGYGGALTDEMAVATFIDGRNNSGSGLVSASGVPGTGFAGGLGRCIP